MFYDMMKALADDALENGSDYRAVYLAGPINGCSDAEAEDWRQCAQRALTCTTFDPMRRDYRGREDQCGTEIVENDKEDIDMSTHLLVNATKPSVGTSMEVLYAWEKGKKVITVAKEPVSPWLRYHSTAVVSTLDEALALINE